MALAHLDDPSKRNLALVSGHKLLEAGSPDAEQRLIEALAQAPASLSPGLFAGDEITYFMWVVETLRELTGAAFALVGELAGEDWDRVSTIALTTPGGPGENFEYDLLGTPCANVVGQTACVYPTQVADLFPHDELLAQMGVESYAGVPLFDPGGRPLGLVILLDQKPWEDARTQSSLSLMFAFRPRLEQLLINRRARRDMQLLSEPFETDSGIDPLGRLALSFAHAMNVRCAFVARALDGAGQRLRPVALAIDGQLGQARDYEVQGTQLAELATRGEILIAEQLDTAWPAAAELASFPGAACLVLSLSGPEGQLLGHLGLIHDRRLNGHIGEQPVAQAFRQRVAFELHRQQVEAERAATERQLLELQRTEGLGILAGGIAHDFNNLLVGVLGNADLALEDAPAEREGEIRECLLDIRDAARTAMQLCRQMLAYAGRTRVELERVELGAELEELSRLLSASIPRTIELRIDGGSGRGAHVIDGDVVQIRQVVMNLITNAGDAIGDVPGRIDLALSSVDVRAGGPTISGVTGDLSPGRYVCLSVRDSGCGMDEATRTRIFDPFFTTKPSGHGLGLAAMLGIVRGHHGTLTVSSTLGQGSEFRVYLPAAAGSEVADETTPATGELAAAKPACVLVVDDEPRVRKVAQRMLERRGYEVLTAVDGLDALERYEQERERIDCVLLDLGMPRLGGVETMRRLRAQDPTLPIIISSGYSEGQAFENIGDDPRCAVVHKPYEVKQLLAVLAQLLEPAS